jgi:hypothetical protein
MASKCLSAVMLCAVMIAASAATASAALPEFSKSAGLKGEFGPVLIETNNNVTIKCETSLFSGEVSGGSKTVVGLKETYKRCKAGTAECTSSGAVEGEIVTEALSGELGYLNASKKEVGLRSESSKGKESAFAAFTCEKIEIVVKGAVIGAFGPVNTETTKFELGREGAKGVQAIKKFEGGLEEVLSVKVIVTAKCDLSSSGKVNSSAAIAVLA